MFVNKNLLQNIRTTVGKVIYSHRGSTIINMVGDLPGYPNPVWFDPAGIANILWLSNVQKIYQVTYDSVKEEVFVVHMRGGQLIFKMAKIGLYYHDMRNKSYMFALPAKKNKQIYTKRQMNGADTARNLQ